MFTPDPFHDEMPAQGGEFREPVTEMDGNYQPRKSILKGVGSPGHLAKQGKKDGGI